MNEFQRPFQPAPGATEIVLVRHGAVTFDGDGLAGGGEDPPLTTAGRAQAHAVTRRLLDEPPDVLVASPLRRARETAAPLAEATGLTPVAIRELREVGLGDWEGALSKRIAEGGPVVARLFAEQRWDVIPGAEPAPRFEARVREGLARVVDLAAHGGRAIAVVHGGVIAEALRQATKSAPFAFLRSENGSISRLVHHPDGRWTLRCFNDTAHLAAPAQRAGAGQ
jgi:probable phosphoglycerate mutase